MRRNIDLTVADHSIFFPKQNFIEIVVFSVFHLINRHLPVAICSIGKISSRPHCMHPDDTQFHDMFHRMVCSTKRRKQESDSGNDTEACACTSE